MLLIGTPRSIGDRLQRARGLDGYAGLLGVDEVVQEEVWYELSFNLLCNFELCLVPRLPTKFNQPGVRMRRRGRVKDVVVLAEGELWGRMKRKRR